MSDAPTIEPNETDAAVPATGTQAANDVDVAGNDAGKDKRDLLRERIEAGERRNQERTLGDYAKDTADSVTNFAKEHPVATVAGAIGIGLAIGAMTRPGRRVAKQGAVKTGAMAALVSEAVMTFGAGLMDDMTDAARNSGDALEDFGDRIGDKARTARRGAAYRSSSLADSANVTKRELSRKAKRGFRDLKNRAKH